MTRTIATVALLAALTACTGNSTDSGTSPPSSSSPPAEVKVVVQLVDALPVEVLHNLDDNQCTSAGFLSDPPPVEVTLRDADGTIVGTTTLPAHGGTFSRTDGCTWPVAFTVAPSTFYEATVTSAEGEATGRAEASDGDVLVPVRL